MMLVEFPLELLPTRLDEYGTVRKYDGRYTAVAVVDPHDELSGFPVAFEPDVQIRNVIGFEKFLCTQAIGAIFGCIHNDLGWGEVVMV